MGRTDDDFKHTETLQPSPPMLMFMDDVIDEASVAEAVPMETILVGDMAVIESISISTDVRSTFWSCMSDNNVKMQV